IAKWKDSDWVSIGKCDGDALLQVLDDRLMVFGNFDSIGGSEYHHLAEWVDGNWVPLMSASPFGPSDAASVMSMGLYQGSYYVGGNLNFGNGLDGIVRWDGQSWRSVGGGLLGPYIWIRTMAEYKGLLFVGGYFWKGAGNAADYVMAWDGEKWFDPFPGVTFTTQPNMLKVIDEKLYILGAHLHESIVGTYSMAHFDGNYFCSFGNGKEVAGDILKWNGELYFCGDVLSQYPNTVKYIGKWIGGESTDICHHNPLPVEYLVSGGGSTVLYPNPPDRYFSPQLPDSATSCEMAVYDAAGREVMGLRPWALGDEPVDISMLPAGVYVEEVRPTTTSGTRRGQVEYIKLIKR
ncbi:MAG: T9SS type A sorting domain-containing protein, partial [Bacteroidia bacterium]